MGEALNFEGVLDIVLSKSLFKRETPGGRQAEEGKVLMERERTLGE